MKLVVQQFNLQNPVWEGEASPGKKLKAKVDAPGITNSQRIEFSIRDTATDEVLDTVLGAAGKTYARWQVPNLPSTANAYFYASLREAPSPDNGQVAAIMWVQSGNQALSSYGVRIRSIDAAFVPNQEKLEVRYRVTDAASKAKFGRMEVWGERYPGTPAKPLYTTKLTIENGNRIKKWDGKANQGHLNGKFITPEFSPYRVRIIIGASKADVEDPYGVGEGKVACAETQFEVKFQSIWIRRWQNLAEAAADDEYKLEKTLLIEPRKADAKGNYTKTKELPEQRPDAQPSAITETGLIRIPMALHQLNADDLDQGGLGIGGAYMGGGSTKWVADEPLYSRPELPIQFEPKLVSRVPATNKEGLFEKDAVGPAIIEPVAEEFYNRPLYEAGKVENQNYWKNATFKVKRGKHNAPYHNASNEPEFHYWQARFEVAADGARDFNVNTFDNTLKYRFGQKELFVYLNRRLLNRSDLNDDTEIDKNKFDYREVSNADNSTQIRLRANLTRQDDVLWIVRKDSTAGGTDVVAKWEQFPPGPNCHLYYGGQRGKEPTADLSNYFRKDFSAVSGTRPIIGKGNAAFPFSAYVDLKPDKADTADAASEKKQERVNTTAMLSGAEVGRAGVIFTPSVIAGDAYTIHAWIEREGYARQFGFVEEEPKVKSKSGTLTVWRWSRIRNSYRLPDVGTNGLRATVGGEAETAQPARGYDGNGANMVMVGGALSLSALYGANTAFNEWTLIPPPAGDGGDPVHKHINLATYRATHNATTNAWLGHVNLASNADVKNYMAVWDAYRENLPPGLSNRPHLIANTIATIAVGTPTSDAAKQVRTALKALGTAPDVALNGGVATIVKYPSNDPDDYESWIDGKWDQITFDVLDALTPKDPAPQKINVIRWPYLHEHGAWIGYKKSTHKVVYSDSMTNGASYGDAQSIFRTAAGSGDGTGRTAATTETFPHEMGHAMNLAHYVAGNFAWKHHDVNSPDCIMSYAHCAGIIRKAISGAPVATGVTRETGWPDSMPHPVPSNTEVAPPGGAGGEACIYFQKLKEIPQPRGAPCAKCLLKVRGWKDDLLPFAWLHPDLF